MAGKLIVIGGQTAELPLVLISADPQRHRLLAEKMEPAKLAKWQSDCGFRDHASAAAALGLSTQAYRAKLKGRSKISRQTEMLCRFVQIYGPRLDATLSALVSLVRLTSGSLLTGK